MFKLPDEWLSLYSIKLYIGIKISRCFVSSSCVLFIWLIHLVDGAQFSNITPLFLSCSCLAAASAVVPVIAILPLSRMYASL